MNLDDDRPICDFCELMIEEDEELEPVFVGTPPKPTPHTLREVADRDGRHTTRVGGNELRMLGRPIGYYQALYSALQSSDDIQIKESMNVEEVRSVGGDTHYADLEHGSVPDMTQFETRTREKKVGVSIRIAPKEVKQDEDAMVCPNCAAMFREMSD